MTENFKASDQDSKKAHVTRAPRKGAWKGNQNRNAKAPAPKRTPEEEKVFQEAVLKAQAAAKVRAELIGSFDKRVESMSYRQIRGELKRIKRGQFLGEPVTLLNIAWAVVADITMQTTKMRDNLAGQLCHYLNPSVSASSPRHTL